MKDYEFHECTSSTRARQGGSCLGVILKDLSSIDLACALRQRGPCVRALCKPVPLLLSKNMTCARPPCIASPSDTLCSQDRISHCTLHSPYFTLRSPYFTRHAPHFISSRLVSPRLISSLLTCHLSFSQLFASHPNIAQLSHLIEALCNSSQLFDTCSWGT